MSKNRIAALGVTSMGIALGLAAFVAAPAHADAIDNFPVVPGAPSWYKTAPAASYNAEQTAFQISSEAATYTEVNYYLPTGIAPTNDADGMRKADISVDNTNAWTVGFKPAETHNFPDSVQVYDLGNDFPQMYRDLGTKMTTGFALGSASKPAATARFLGNGKVEIDRPPLSDCEGNDPSEFMLSAVMLGGNGSKYLVSFDTSFNSDAHQARVQECLAASGRGNVPTVAPQSAQNDQSQAGGSGTNDQSGSSQQTQQKQQAQQACLADTQCSQMMQQGSQQHSTSWISTLVKVLLVLSLIGGGAFAVGTFGIPKWRSRTRDSSAEIGKLSPISPEFVQPMHPVTGLPIPWRPGQDAASGDGVLGRASDLLAGLSGRAMHADAGADPAEQRPDSDHEHWN